MADELLAPGRRWRRRRFLAPMRRPSALRIYLRYARYLLWEFRWSLGIFWSLVLVGGFVLHLTYHDPEQHGLLSYGESCYAIFMLIFLESYLKFPAEWYLQPFFFLLPVVGLGAVADSLVRLAYLTFSSKQRLPEWQRMVASLYRQHVVVVGVGKVGFEIIKGLLAMQEPVVVIERPESSSELIDEIQDLKVPVIRGDGRSRKSLEEAGVQHAHAVVLATSDDLANLDSALTARDLNARAQIVLRLFDASLAGKVRGAFAMPAISTAQVAAPAFIAAATGRRIYQQFQLSGKSLHLCDLTVCPGSRLVGKTVGEIQADQVVNIVMHSSASGVSVNPGHDLTLAADDELIVIGPIERLTALEAENRPLGRSGRPAPPLSHPVPSFGSAVRPQQSSDGTVPSDGVSPR